MFSWVYLFLPILLNGPYFSIPFLYLFFAMLMPDKFVSVWIFSVSRHLRFYLGIQMSVKLSDNALSLCLVFQADESVSLL